MNSSEILRKTGTTFIGRKLDIKFQIKDLTKNQHEHNLIHYSKCLPETNYNEDCLDETGRRRIERIAAHCGKDKQSHFDNTNFQLHLESKLNNCPKKYGIFEKAFENVLNALMHQRN